MSKIALNHPSYVRVNQIQSSLPNLNIQELVDRITSCSEFAVAHPKYIFAILLKYFSMIKYTETGEKREKVGQILTHLMKIYGNKDVLGELNKFLFQRFRRLGVDLGMNLSKSIKQEGNNGKFMEKREKQKLHLLKSGNEGKINQELGMMRQGNFLLQNTHCLGCMQAVHKGIMPKFKQYGQNYLLEKGSLFVNQQYHTENICAMLNSGGGFVFIAHEGSSAAGLEGYCLSISDKAKYRAFIDKCFKYIEPAVDRESYCVDFLPLVDNSLGSDQPTAKWIIKVSVKPRKSKFLYYVSYKLLISQKRNQVQFFKFNQQGDVDLMQFEEVYSQIHSIYQQRIQNGYASKHQGVQCCLPLELATVPQGQLVASCNLNQTLPNVGGLSCQGTNKFKYSLVVIKQKEGKEDEKRIQQIERQIVSNKILCQIEMLELKETKTKYWVISYDCPSEVVEQIIKQYNRNGELSLARAKRCVKVTDEQFLLEKKDEAIIKKVKCKLEAEGKQSKLEYKVFNTQEKTINRASKLPVYLQFKNLRHAILCYSLLYASNRRLEFVQIKH